MFPLCSDSLIHTGVACFGLSKAVVHYLLTKYVDSQKGIPIEMEDISCPQLRHCISLLDGWIPGNPLSTENKHALLEQAAIAGFNAPLDFENKIPLREALIIHHVIDSRKSQLDDLKIAFRETGLLDFIDGREYLWEAAFPPVSALTFTPATIMRNIEFEGESSGAFEDALKNILEELSPEQIRKLLIFWTAFPILPNEKLTVAVGDYDFRVSTCLNTMYIPHNMDFNEFKVQLKACIEIGSAGFGSV